MVSIVTPTYNRAAYLMRCFESLKAQTNRSFEWIIVDDGSTDHTNEVVDNMVSNADDIPIQYIYKENGGKHTAMNASHPYIHGEFVLILDSDDYLTADAVERVLDEWNQFQKDEKVGTLIFLRGDSKLNPRAYGKQERVPGDYRKLKRVKVTSSDCCEVFRAKLFINYPYSVFEGERFLSESELWNRLAEDGYQCVYINRVIYVCEYLEGGLTDSGRRMRIRSPLGGMCTSELIMNKKYPLQVRVRKSLLYVCYGFFAGLTPSGILTRSKENRSVKLLCLVPGYIMYRIWKRRYT